VSFLFSLIFAILILGLTICVLIFAVFVPMIKNKIKETKTMLVDYPKIMREGSFNDKSVEIVKSYLRIVFKEELESIHITLREEMKKEIKTMLEPATSGFKSHDDAIKKIQENVDLILNTMFKTDKSQKEQEQIIQKKIHSDNQDE
jgi:hypothetical protein